MSKILDATATKRDNKVPLTWIRNYDFKIADAVTIYCYIQRKNSNLLKSGKDHAYAEGEFIELFDVSKFTRAAVHSSVSRAVNFLLDKLLIVDTTGKCTYKCTAVNIKSRGVVLIAHLFASYLRYHRVLMFDEEQLCQTMEYFCMWVCNLKRFAKELSYFYVLFAVQAQKCELLASYGHVVPVLSFGQSSKIVYRLAVL
tara:strand:+ start:1640 stop:2236 length:597 start_codon:yes stop_codon:yes gene_type:complete